MSVLVLASGDSGCDAKAGVDAATNIVNVEQASIIVGPLCSGATIGATQAVTIPAGVVNISPSATSPAITGLDDNDLVFRVCPSDAYQGVTIAKLARSMGYSKLERKNITLLQNCPKNAWCNTQQTNHPCR